MAAPPPFDLELDQLLARQQLHHQEHQQVSLEAAIAFIQDCDFDSGDEDHDEHDHVDSLGHFQGFPLQQRAHALVGPPGLVGRQQHQHEFQMQLSVHPQQAVAGYHLAGASTSRPATTFGLHAQGGSVHGSGSGMLEGEQAPIGMINSGGGKNGSAKHVRLVSAAVTEGAQGVSSTSSPVSSLRDTELDKRFRGRRKDELLYLREKMEEFQNQLDQLKKAARSHTASQPTVGSERGSPGVVALQGANEQSLEEARSPSMWEMLATRQSEERRKVEEENAKLKSALDKQIRMAKSLEKILRKRASATLLHHSAPASKRLKQISSGSSEGGREGRHASDDADFNEMLAGMEELYRRVDYNIFDTLQQQAGVASSDYPAPPILEANVKHDKENGIFVESLDSWTVPFEFEIVKRVMWRFMSGERGAKYHSYLHEHVDVTEDSIIRSYVVELDDAGGKTTISGKQTVHRCVEENQCVTVWRSLFKPLGGFTGAGGEAKRMALRESGWYAIKRRAANTDTNIPQSGSARLPSTLIQSCSYISPVLTDDDAAEDNYKVGALTDFAVTSREESIKAYHQALENLLLAESMKA